MNTPDGSLDCEDPVSHAVIPGDWHDGFDTERWLAIEP